MIWTLRRENTMGTHSPGGPVVKIPYSQCRGAGLTPGQETKIPKLRFWGVAKKKKKKKEHSDFRGGGGIFSWALTVGQLLEMFRGRSGLRAFRVEGRGGESTEWRKQQKPCLASRVSENGLEGGWSQLRGMGLMCLLSLLCGASSKPPGLFFGTRIQRYR